MRIRQTIFEGFSDGLCCTDRHTGSATGDPQNSNSGGDRNGRGVIRYLREGVPGQADTKKEGAASTLNDFKCIP